MPADDEESWVIRLLAPPVAALPPEVRVGIGDDAAVLQDGRVITVDTMVEGVHWDDRSTAADVGAKLALVNASDVAACGAVPTLALLSLSLPDPVDRAWVQGFAEGLREGLAERCWVPEDGEVVEHHDAAPGRVRGRGVPELG